MKNRKNFFNAWEDFDEIFRQFFGHESMIRGDREVEKGKDKNGEWTTNTYTSEDGQIQIHNFVRTSTFPEEFINMFAKPSKKTNTIENLKRELDRAVENEDFLLAIKIRDMIKEKESNKDIVEKLEKDLKNSIEKQDFETSIKIREELKKYQN
jgi:excinuclease UvrABC helicase subunit UvrB